MSAVHSLSPSEFAYDVLVFMRRHVSQFSMLSDMLQADIDRWYSLPLAEQRVVFERQRRRFETVCPTLARKDRVRDAAQGLAEVSFALPDAALRNNQFRYSRLA